MPCRRKAMPPAREILHDVSFTVPDKGFTVITGPNGGGKSTLAKLVMGVVTPTSGQILFNGEDITQLDITARARLGIGFAFQQPVRFKGLTVRELLQLATGRPISTDVACSYLSEVGLCAADYINREINASLSGGELKRIEIAMLIARGTKLSIFDEPEAGIDLWSFHNLIRVFENIRDSSHGAVIIISHQERILSIADQIAVIAGGRLTAFGPRAEILPDLLCDSEECRFYKQEA
ncbi:ATP-binding cassette domain-containing protein [Eubacteriales bacterium OttesenSCG-928-A19]|nr:ATP-binding cassette domain-containing protein [Eubacteriales bacterium OttesenSCG-928-A19]